jgi:RNA polymerase sigma-70 factor (ECF subfamily)
MKLLTRGIRLSPEKEKAFLLTCTANACKDLLRSFWRTHTQPLDDVIIHVTESDKSLWEAIGKLPPKYRVVIHLYYYEGYSQKQIAEILKISRAAVQARMDRARTQLEKELRIDA